MVFALPLRFDAVQSATRTTASSPGRRLGSQTTMCASAGLNMQTTHREGSCRAGVRDLPRVEVWDVRGPDGISLPCGP